MTRMKKRVWMATTAAIIGGALATTASLYAQTPGEVITFLLPAAGNQPGPTASGPTDRLFYIGGSVTMIDASTCGGGTSNPVQNVILVDPGPDGRSSRIVGVVSYRSSALAPGTKLGTLTFKILCTVGGTEYQKYDGTVE